MANSAFKDIHNSTINLPYWEIDDGIMFLHGGKKFEFGIEINPPAALFMSDNRLRGLWSAVKSILRVSPPNARIRVMVASLPTRAGVIDEYFNRKTTDDQILQRLARARHNMYQRARIRGEGYEHRFYVMMSLPMVKTAKGTSLTPDQHERVMTNAREQRKQLAERFSRIGYDARIMNSQDVFEVCWQYFNPELVGANTPEFVPMQERAYYSDKTLRENQDLDMPTVRRQMLNSVFSNRSNEYMKIGAKYARIMALKRLPDSSSPNQVDRLLQAMGANHFYLVLDFEHEPSGPTLRKLTTRLQGFKGALSAEAEGRASADVSVSVNASNLERVIAHVKSTNDEIFNASVSMVIFGDSREHLNEVRDISLSALAELGNTQPVIGTFQNVPMYQQSLAPFGGGVGDFQFKTVELNVSDFFPLASSWKGSAPMTLMESRTGGLIQIDMFNPQTTNWNAVITGGSGAGKTMLALNLLRDAMAENVEAFVIDRGFGYAPLIEAVEGDIITMDPSNGITINPFDLDEDELTPTEERVNFVISIVKTMITLSSEPSIAEVEEQILRDAVIKTYEAAILPDYTDTGEEVMRYVGTRMSSLVRKLATIEEVGGRQADKNEINMAKQLATRLSRWTGNNPEGRVVDGDTNININNPAMYFETTGLINNPDIGRVVLLLLSDLIFKRFAKNPYGRKIVLFDEAWALFDNPEARKLIIELYRRARRYNAAIYSVTQGINDLLKIESLIDQCNYFYVGISSGNEEDLQELPGMRDNDAAISAYQSLRIVKGEYSEYLAWIRAEGEMEGDVIRLVPSRLDLWMFSTNAKDMERRNRIAESKFNGNVYMAALAMGEAEEAELNRSTE